MTKEQFIEIVKSVFPKASIKGIEGRNSALYGKAGSHWAIRIGNPKDAYFEVYWGTNIGWSVDYRPSNTTLQQAKEEYCNFQNAGIYKHKAEIALKRRLLARVNRMTRGAA